MDVAKVYYPQYEQVEQLKIHQSRTQPYPFNFPAGYYWYGLEQKDLDDHLIGWSCSALEVPKSKKDVTTIDTKSKNIDNHLEDTQLIIEIDHSCCSIPTRRYLLRNLKYSVLLIGLSSSRTGENVTCVYQYTIILLSLLYC